MAVHLKKRTLERGQVFGPKSARGVARAATLSAAHPLTLLRNGGERGTPQPEADNLEHLRQCQAQAEKCVAHRVNWAGEAPQGLALAGCLASLGAHMLSPGRAHARASITPLFALERYAGAEYQQVAGGHAMRGLQSLFPACTPQQGTCMMGPMSAGTSPAKQISPSRPPAPDAGVRWEVGSAQPGDRAGRMRALSSPGLLAPCPAAAPAGAGPAAGRPRCAVAVRCSEGQAQVANPGKRAEQFGKGLVIPARLVGQESLSAVRAARRAALSACRIVSSCG